MLNDYTILGKLDTDAEKFEEILLDNISPTSDRWKETNHKKLQRAFKNKIKKYGSIDNTANEISRNIGLLCNASIMTLNFHYLNVAKYWLGVLVTHTPRKEKDNLINNMANKLKIKSPTNSRFRSVSHSEKKKDTYLQFWNKDHLKITACEEIFKNFNLKWKKRCKNYIKELNFRKSCLENAYEPSVFERLVWLFEQLQYFEEHPKDKKKHPIPTQEAFKMFEPFKYVDPDHQKIVPKNSIERIIRQLEDQMLDSAILRYKTVANLIFLETLPMIKRSLATVERLDISAFKAKKHLEELSRINNKYKLNAFHQFKNLDEFIEMSTPGTSSIASRITLSSSTEMSDALSNTNYSDSSESEEELETEDEVHQYDQIKLTGVLEHLDLAISRSSEERKRKLSNSQSPQREHRKYRVTPQKDLLGFRDTRNKSLKHKSLKHQAIQPFRNHVSENWVGNAAPFTFASLKESKGKEKVNSDSYYG